MYAPGFSCVNDLNTVKATFFFLSLFFFLLTDRHNIAHPPYTASQAFPTNQIERHASMCTGQQRKSRVVPVLVLFAFSRSSSSVTHEIPHECSFFFFLLAPLFVHSYIFFFFFWFAFFASRGSEPCVYCRNQTEHNCVILRWREQRQRGEQQQH